MSLTNKEIKNRIKDFYNDLQDVYHFSWAFDAMIDGNNRVLQYVYYQDINNSPLSKVSVLISFKEEKGSQIKNDFDEPQNLIEKINVYNEYIKFTWQELKLFDQLDFQTTKKFQESMNQTVEDWFSHILIKKNK